MRPAESFIGQPIRALQTMLRTIAESDSSQVSVIPDGIYGPETGKAVSVFQRNHGLPVTGVTDQITWETITAAYEPAVTEQAQAHPLYIAFDAGQVFATGDKHPHVYLAQAMLVTLSDRYGSIGRPGLTGQIDEATREALESFQQISGLPMTGQLDKQTWKHLVLQYPLAANSREPF